MIGKRPTIHAGSNLGHLGHEQRLRRRASEAALQCDQDADADQHQSHGRVAHHRAAPTSAQLDMIATCGPIALRFLTPEFRGIRRGLLIPFAPGSA